MPDRVHPGQRRSISTASLGTRVRRTRARSSHPTPLRMAKIIVPRSRALVITVTSHSCRFTRNMGKPIRRIDPKNSTRYGTRMTYRLGERNSTGQA